MLTNYKGKCSLEIYTRFLIAQPYRAECTKLASLMPNMAHDAINRFLNNSNFEPKDLFNLVKDKLDLEGGTLSVDDTILDKPYSKLKYCPLLGMFYSGKHKKVVKGLCLISLIYTDCKGVSMPVHFAIADKEDANTRNQLLRDMLEDVVSWGIKAKTITFDNAYATVENFELINIYKIDCLFTIAKNQEIYTSKGRKTSIAQLSFLNKQGKIVECSLTGTIKIFQQYFPKAKELRHYAYHSEQQKRVQACNRRQFRHLRGVHWGIERYHRSLKQNCCIEKFMVRSSQAIANHIFCALLAFCYLEQAVVEKVHKSWYKFKSAIVSQAVGYFIQFKNQKKSIYSKIFTTNLHTTSIVKVSFDSS